MNAKSIICSFMMAAIACCAMALGRDVRSISANTDWKEEVRVLCVGHGSDHPGGYHRMHELMKDSHLHATEIALLIEETTNDRPLARLSYFVYHATLGKKSKENLLSKCVEKAKTNQWNETLYFFVSETRFFSRDELLQAQYSSSESVALAAQRAIVEHRFNEPESPSESNRRNSGLGENSPRKNGRIVEYGKIAISIGGLIFLLWSSKKMLSAKTKSKKS